VVEKMNPVVWAFDGLLCLTLVFLAWRLICMPDLFRAVMLFFVFGLLMSLAWVRLQAVDVALAEAAIGAGLTGALFLATLSRLRHRSAQDPDAEDRARRARTIQREEQGKSEEA
jgi:energy-converting hydrogenase B subunit D